MTGWIVLAAWAAGFVVASRKVSCALIADDEKAGGTPDKADRALLRTLGCVIGLLWPVLLAGALVTGRLPKTGAQLRAEREKLSREIAELEAENERLRREQESTR